MALQVLTTLSCSIAESATRMLERRRFPRVTFKVEALVHVDERVFRASSVNLSAGGALLELASLEQVGPFFLLHLLLPDLQHPTPLSARRVELRGRKLRLSFDPAPSAVAEAIHNQWRARLEARCKLN